MNEIKDLTEKIVAFSNEREWDEFHSPANLAKSIAIEAGELLECFQWDEKDFDKAQVEDELADVLNYCLLLADKLQIDPKEIVEKKLFVTAEKYPVTKSKGLSIKYDKLK